VILVGAPGKNLCVVQQSLDYVQFLIGAEFPKEVLVVVQTCKQRFQEDLILSIVYTRQTRLVILEEVHEAVIVLDSRDRFQDLISLLDGVGYTVASTGANLRTENVIRYYVLS
jgi:hypothetical protein